jgi:hypothetical protein
MSELRLGVLWNVLRERRKSTVWFRFLTVEGNIDFWIKPLKV